MKRTVLVLVLVALIRASAAEANHTKVYVANQGSNTVMVIDDQRVSAMTRARAGQTGAEDTARVADQSFAVVATIPAGANPIAVAMSTDGTLAYVANLEVKRQCRRVQECHPRGTLGLRALLAIEIDYRRGRLLWG
jgi:hypothetical protein